MGRAIVTSDAPGCRETVENERNGFLVRVKSVDELVEKMEYLIQYPEVNAKMGKESLKMVQKFDVRKVNAELARIMKL